MNKMLVVKHRVSSARVDWPRKSAAACETPALTFEGADDPVHVGLYTGSERR